MIFVCRKTFLFSCILSQSYTSTKISTLPSTGQEIFCGKLRIQKSESESENDSDSKNQDGEGDAEYEEELREKAKKAVDEAKNDLLKHTLEIMIKQNLLTREKAVKLFQRALNGDVLIDTAIKSYAKDRSVVEFLDALQILGNHTGEEILQMMNNNKRSVSFEQEKEEESSESESSQSESGSETESESESQSDEEEEEVPRSTNTNQYDKKQQYLRELITELYEHQFVDKDTAVTLLYLNSVKDRKILTVLDAYA